MIEAEPSRVMRTTITLCFLAAVFEGVDLQAMGIAAPQLIPEFGLSKPEYGFAASMSAFGLPIGAALGGRAADALGRRNVLVTSLLLLGIFSLLTAIAGSYRVLLSVRFLVGLGLGGAFPTLISLISECAAGVRRSTPMSLMYAGIPMGTIVGTLTVLYFGSAFQWRWIFYVGGFGPLLLAPIVFLYLPETLRRASGARGSVAAAGRLMPVRHVLFSQGRATPTLLLWLSFFFTLVVIYLLTNWLNQLMVQRGFTSQQSTVTLLAFGVGSVCGSRGFGAILDAGYRRYTAAAAYCGMALSLSGLALSTGFPLLVIASFGAGVFGIGAQLINYVMAPEFYHAGIRGTGVGSTVAVGRLGSVTGPLLAGILLGSGLSASQVLLTIVPGLIVAAVASSWLMARAPPHSRSAASESQIAAKAGESR